MSRVNRATVVGREATTRWGAHGEVTQESVARNCCIGGYEMKMEKEETGKRKGGGNDVVKR